MTNQNPNDWKSGLSLTGVPGEVKAEPTVQKTDSPDILKLAQEELQRVGGNFGHYLNEVTDVAESSEAKHRVSKAAVLLFAYYTNWNNQYSQNGQIDLDRAEYYLAKTRTKNPADMMLEVEARNNLAHTCGKTLGVEKMRAQYEKADCILQQAVNANYSPALRWCVENEQELAAGRFPGDTDHSELLYKAFTLWSKHPNNDVEVFREEAADKAKYYEAKSRPGGTGSKRKNSRGKAGRTKTGVKFAKIVRFSAIDMIRLLLAFVFTPIMLYVSYRMAVDNGDIGDKSGVLLASTLGLINWLILKIAKAVLQEDSIDPGPIYLVVHGLLALFGVSFLMIAVTLIFGSCTNGDPYVFLSTWLCLAFLGSGAVSVVFPKWGELPIAYWYNAVILNGVLAVVIYVLVEIVSIIPVDFILGIEFMIKQLKYFLNFK